MSEEIQDFLSQIRGLLNGVELRREILEKALQEAELESLNALREQADTLFCERTKEVRDLGFVSRHEFMGSAKHDGDFFYKAMFIKGDFQIGYSLERIDWGLRETFQSDYSGLKDSLQECLEASKSQLQERVAKLESVLESVLSQIP